MLFNTIHHDIRNNAKLSLLDYCILEMIYNLSSSGKERYTTWCNASKSAFLHLASDRTILNRFNHLEEKGWLEFKNEKRFLKRTTPKYKNSVQAYIKGTKKLPTRYEEITDKGTKELPTGTKELPIGYEEVAPNKNKDNNKIKEEGKNTLLDIDFIEEEQKEEVDAKPSLSPLKKPYEIFLNNYQFTGWSETQKENFLMYCEVKHENSKGRYGATQVKSRIAEITAAMENHEIRWIEKLIIEAMNGGWASFDFDDRIPKRKKKEAKENGTGNLTYKSYFLENMKEIRTDKKDYDMALDWITKHGILKNQIEEFNSQVDSLQAIREKYFLLEKDEGKYKNVSIYLIYDLINKKMSSPLLGMKENHIMENLKKFVDKLSSFERTQIKLKVLLNKAYIKQRC